MKDKWTRRKFLKASLRSSIVVSVGTAASKASISPVTAKEESSTATGLSSQLLQVLRTVMDEIIPAGDGMPSASEAGGMAYLDRLARENTSIKKELEKSLNALTDVARNNFTKDFPSLSHEQRVEALKKLEKQQPSEIFASLRDYVYEAYYTQPQVWKLIGYEFHATNQHGPRMKPFDESVLAQVRKMPKLYREVG